MPEMQGIGNIKRLLPALRGETAAAREGKMKTNKLTGDDCCWSEDVAKHGGVCNVGCKLKCKYNHKVPNCTLCGKKMKLICEDCDVYTYKCSCGMVINIEKIPEEEG